MENKWDMFKKVACWMMAAAVVGLVLDFIFVSDKNFRLNMLVFCLSLLIVSLVEYIKCKRMLGSEEKMKADRIRINDERNVQIRTKATESTFNTLSLLICLAVLVFGFIDDKIFFTLTAFILLLNAVYFAFVLYYRKKF